MPPPGHPVFDVLCLRVVLRFAFLDIEASLTLAHLLSTSLCQGIRPVLSTWLVLTGRLCPHRAFRLMGEETPVKCV